MKLSEIQNMWEQDCPINKLNLDDESLLIPKLHSKYYNLMNSENTKLIKLRGILKKMKLEKWEWYTGKTTNSEGKAFHLKILKADIQTYIEADKDILDIEQKIQIQELKVNTLKDIIGTINARNWVIRNAIEWQRFTNGVI